MLQLADRLFRLPHAFGSRIHLAAQEIGILTIDGHLGERLDLALDAIELDRDEVGVLLGTTEVVEPSSPIAMLSCSDRTTRSSPPLPCAAVEALVQLLEPRGNLLLVHRLEKAVERRAATAAAGETARAGDRAPASWISSPRSLVAGRAANAGGYAAHLEAARVKPLEAQPASRVAGRSASTPATPAAPAAVLPCRQQTSSHEPSRRSPLGTAESTPVRRDTSARPQRRAAAARRRRRQRGSGGAADEQQQVPPEQKCFLEVVGHPARPRGS